MPVADADDVTQEVMLAIHRSSASFRAPEDRDRKEAWAAWCLGVVRKHAAAYRRDRRTEPSAPLAEVPDEASLGAVSHTPESAAIRRQTLVVALKILSALDSRLRAVFVAYAVAGTPMREIAAKAGTPVNTAWTMLRRARGEIQARVERLRARERGDESTCRRRAVRT